jgi:hypothetical protein
LLGSSVLDLVPSEMLEASSSLLETVRSSPGRALYFPVRLNVGTGESRLFELQPDNRLHDPEIGTLTFVIRAAHDPSDEHSVLGDQIWVLNTLANGALGPGRLARAPCTRRMAVLPGIRGSGSARALPAPCPASARHLRRERDRRLGPRVRVRGSRARMCSRRRHRRRPRDDREGLEASRALRRMRTGSSSLPTSRPSRARLGSGSSDAVMPYAAWPVIVARQNYRWAGARTPQLTPASSLGNRLLRRLAERGPPSPRGRDHRRIDRCLCRPADHLLALELPRGRPVRACRRTRKGWRLRCWGRERWAWDCCRARRCQRRRPWRPRAGSPASPGTCSSSFRGGGACDRRERGGAAQGFPAEPLDCRRCHR